MGLAAWPVSADVDAESAHHAAAAFETGTKPAPGRIKVDTIRASSSSIEGVDSTILRRLLDDARASRADGVVIVKNGKLIAHEGAEAVSNLPILARSLTKPFTSTAVGMLIDAGKIPSVDTPV